VRDPEGNLIEYASIFRFGDTRNDAKWKTEFQTSYQKSDAVNLEEEVFSWPCEI
jgi:hypothetical protein